MSDPRRQPAPVFLGFECYVHYHVRTLPKRPTIVDVVKGSYAMHALPIPLKATLRRFGGDLRDARLRRRIPAAIMAQRAGISRTTLLKVEKGDPGVAAGTYAAVLFVLGMLDRLA